MANGTLAASQIEMLSQSGTGIITITPPATNTNRAITLPDAAGAIVVSGTTPSLNGITFPATQVASADANTLDDYEEGTFNTTDLSGAGLTFLTSTGTYVKIGQLVYFQNKLLFPSTASSLSTLISLPFPVFNNANTFPQGPVGSNGNASVSLIFGYNGTATASLSGIGASSNVIATNANCSLSNLNINLIYRTSS